MAAANKTLGRFTLANIPAAPRGVPQIEVTFDIDANGIVNVSAKDRGTGQEQKITITGSTTLDDSEVDQMVADAEAHADEDAKLKESVEARNTADSLVYQTEKTITDLGDKVPAETKDEVEAAIAEMKTSLEGDDVEDIKAKTEALTTASFKLAEIAYQQVQDETGEAGDGAEVGEDGEEVVDGDFEVVEEDDKK
jgi:molecular chaperone DnaK